MHVPYQRHEGNILEHRLEFASGCDCEDDKMLAWSFMFVRHYKPKSYDDTK